MNKNKNKSQKTDNGCVKQRNGLIIKKDPISKEIHYYEVNDIEVLYKCLSFIMTPTFITIAEERCDKLKFNKVTFRKKLSLCEQAYSFFNSKSTKYLDCQYFYTEAIPGYFQLLEEEKEQFTDYQKKVSLALYTLYFIKEIWESLKRENK